jgi:hypothetical protein
MSQYNDSAEQALKLFIIFSAVDNYKERHCVYFYYSLMWIRLRNLNWKILIRKAFADKTGINLTS